MERIRHRLRCLRIARARVRGRHERAVDLLRRELYGDFTRPMAGIYLEMATDLLALGRTDEALGHLRLAEDASLDDRGRLGKRILTARALVAAGKLGEAEARLGDVDGATLAPEQARLRRAALAELAIARRDWDAAARAADDGLEPWGRLARGAEALVQGDATRAREHLGASVVSAEGDPDAAVVRRQAARLLERASRQERKGT